MSFKAKSSHSDHWKQIYLQKYWGCSWDRHTHRAGFNRKRTEISRTFGQHTYVQVLEDGCRYLTAARRHLGGGIHGATSVSAFVLSSWLPCWLLLRSPWDTQIPMNSHCKGNWSTRTWLLLTAYKEARYLSAFSSLNVWQVHTSLMLEPLSSQQGPTFSEGTPWFGMAVLKLGKIPPIQKETLLNEGLQRLGLQKSH